MKLCVLIAITILTWNTGRMDFKHKPENNEVLQYLLSQDADVVCLQEVDVYKDPKYLTLSEPPLTFTFTCSCHAAFFIR